MSDASTALAELPSEDRRRLLAQILKQQAEQSRTFPLSYAQERLWLLDQLEPGNPVYNIPLAIRLSGALDLEALDHTLCEIVARHESLRTRFVMLDDEPAQLVEPAESQQVTVVDLQHLAPADREAEAMAWAESEAKKPFHLTKGPLLRTSLLRLSAEEHILVVVMHHIISDDWSMGVLFRDVATLYQDFTAQRPSTLDDLPIQYADYAVWQREHLQGQLLEDLLDYWRDRLDGVTPLELPTDRPRPLLQGYAGRTETALLPSRLAQQLREVGRREGATLFMTLLAAFEVLLHRYSGQDDIAVGSPIAGRLKKETEQQVGFFVNTLVMRSDLAGNPTFRDVLQQVRQTAMKAFQNQELPFERLVEAVNPDRDTSRHPLFQVAFTLQNAPWPVVRIANLSFSPIPLDTGAARFDLWLSMRETDDGLQSMLEYRTELFDTATIRRMLGNFQVLLEAVVADPDQPIARLPLLTDHERRQLLIEWNDTAVDYHSDECLHQLVEAQVARTPDAVALVFEDKCLSYRELNERANQLAHYLARYDVQPDVAVGVCLERSFEMVISLLAIQKAGGAYAPLDPDYPTERLGFMAQDSRPAAVLTTTALKAHLPEVDAPVVCLDEIRAQLALEKTDNPACPNSQDDIAYVIYTSGSTGTPKGVRNSHRGICNRLLWMQQQYQLTADDRVLQKTPYSFDVSVWEFFWPLMIGARLVVAKPGGHKDGRYLARLIVDQQITTLHFVPSMLQLFLEEDEVSACRSLKRVICSGEALPYDAQQRFFARLSAELHNLYGPTEAAVDVTYWQCRENELGIVPIGKPVANTQCYILDGQMNSVPVGVAGELHLGGVQLARDYLNRPELTAEKFVPDPFSAAPKARLYKTGDLCRYLPDGNIQFLGRLDHQVKIRGNRIELGEIQAVLLKHPQIQEAVVTAWDDDTGSKQLAAYLVAEGETAPGATELREFLSNSLPDYMIPTAFVSLESIPLGSSGKVNRRALPRPVPARDDQTEYVAPRTADEASLAEIWSEVLHVERVGVNDNFFALGGHSLLAARVASRITRDTGVELPLRDIFQTPTVAELARRLQELRERGTGAKREPISIAPREGQLLPSFTQEALWFLDQLERDRPTYTVYPTVRLNGPLDVDVLQRALDEIVRRHESLRTRFPEVDGRPMQVIDPFTPQPLALFDLSDLPDEQRQRELERHIEDQMQRPIDLRHGPLIRVTLVRLSSSEHVIAAAAHHVIYDGWSLGVFTRELAILYDAYRAGRPSPLPELSIQYADFAAWQRQVLQGESLERLSEYWVGQLDGVSPLELPTDYVRPTLRTTCGAVQPCDLSPELSTALREFCRREEVTPFMALLAALQVLLYRYSGQDDIAVGSPVANRLQPETEPLIGYFVNVVVLRTVLAGDPSFREMLKRVRQVSLDAFEHQEMTFDQVVNAVKPPRDTSRHPLFQVMFALLNAEPPTLSGLGLEVTPYESTPRTPSAYFDLTLELTETEQGFHGGLSFSTDLFRPETIGRMVDHFRQLLATAVAEPERPVSTLPIITPAEREEAIDRWNDTRAQYDTSVCIHRRIEDRAAERPEAVAVVLEDRQWTYGELNERANQLARHLQGQGVGPDVTVGICLERSPELAMAVLAVMKAGGAYVPLDPAHSGDARQRLDFVLQDAAVSLVVTDQTQAGSFDADQIKLAVLDGAQATDMGAQSRDNLPCAAAADNLAYILYTSGSTGQPKGVMITRGNLLNAYCGWETEYRLRTDATSHLQMASFGFDVFAGDFVRALCSGGKLVICPKEVLLSPDRLLDLMQRRQIDTAEFVPIVLRNLVQHLEDTDQSLDFMRLVVVGSDAWYVSDHERTRRVIGRQARLINSYGLTETTIDSSYFDGELGTSATSGLVPIGRPFPNVRLYILDEHGQPLPTGVPGELYIGGAGVARGYVDAKLNAERFLDDPFDSEPTARMCRTGDRARRRADGQIEFLGRADDQVKIRGFRIEPGEVEKVLRQHAALAQAAVVACEHQPGDLQLVAYVVGQQGAVPTIPEMRKYLGERLPDYMVPRTFVELDALPMTRSGKVDRRALPEPDWSRSALVGEFVAPQTDDQRQLAKIWCDILKVEQVGIRDDFFDLGGHSLLATQLISRINEEFEIWISLRDLFAGPTVEGLAQRILAARESGARTNLPAIVPASRESSLPLSYGQESLWVINQFEGERSAYAMFPAARIRGPLNVEALERTLDEIVRRHESLRTTFALDGGSPAQVIAPHTPFQLPLVDLGHLPADEQEEEVKRYVQAQSLRRIDLSQGPLARIELLRLNEEEHVVAVGMHHIIYDGWSLEVLRRELTAAYRAFSADLPSPLPELPVQYADYAVWQRERLTGETLSGLRDYWQKQLADVPVLELPIDRPRPAMRTNRGTRRDCRLPRRLSRAIQDFSAQEGATHFMTLLAALQVLLQRYSGQDEFAVGSPVAGRLRPEVEGLIGYFVNTLALRADLRGNPTFRELVGRVRETALEAFDHQELPFERLVEELHTSRDTSRHPVFQVLFVLQNMQGATQQDSQGLEFSMASPPHSRLDFDLMLEATETDSGMELQLMGNADLFEQDTVDRMLEHLKVVLQDVLANPDQPVSQVTMITEREREQLLIEWNDPAAPAPAGDCIHQLFESHAQQTPDATAVVFEDVQLTYHELNCRANQVAHRLQKLGVGPDDLVALYLDRSLDMAVAVLGVLKAGGAYLPMDLVYPQDRLAFMLDESEAKVLLTQEPLLDQLPEQGARVVCLDRDWESIAEESDATPPCRTTADNLAYVIYTSGSTGRPKGALITHANVTRLLTQTEAWFHFSADDVWTMFHSYAFDFSVWELWGALLYGGKVVVVPYWVSRSPEAFHELLCREQVTVLNQTPSAFHQLIAADEQAESKSQPLSLRYVIFGGEALNPQTLKPWFERHGDQHPQLVNMYGITETTVHVTYYPMSRADLDHPSRSPIGRPIPDLQVYVLDDHGQLAPVGVPGELYVGGAGVARGYLKRPELTQQRFLPDPYSDQADAHLYKTGDRGRWLPGGCLEYLGRGDDQVKIRGFRIELGEIESVLAEHPTIRQVAVMLREDRGGDQRLAAYIVADGESSASLGELRAFVEKKLPNYMVPSAFVTLEKLPLTHNGKVDRRALPALDDSRPDLSVGYVAPRNELERQLAEMWQELLRVDRAGVHDDFFELGGHSLVATQVISRINEEFEVWISLRDLFAAPTIEGMAARVVAAREAGARASLPAIESASREVSLPLSFGQEALWVISQLEGDTSAYAMFPAGRIRGPLNVQALERTLDEIVRRHEPLRTTFAVVDGSPVQVIAPHTPFQLPLVDLSHLPAEEREEEVKRYVQAQSLRKIDLSTGPLARIELLRLSEEEHVVVVGMHHIIYDGWSLDVLRRELTAAYRAFSADQPSPLPELPVQYADYAVWQRQRLTGETLSGLHDFWQQKLAGVPVLELPTDRPRPAMRTTRGTQRECRLSKRLSQAVQQLAAEQGATTFMTLLAAWQTLLQRYSGQNDFAVGSPVAGRLRPEIEGLIGYFVNTLALRVNLDGDPTFRDLVGRVRETSLEAFDHQELPFERLVEQLHPSRDTSRHPVFQVLFALQNVQDEPEQNADGLEFSMTSPPHSRLDFDLMLAASPTSDGIQLQLTGNADLFEQETVERMLTHLQLLLESATSDPDQPISNLAIITDREREQLLIEWNDPAAPAPADDCIHQLFESHAQQTPDATAVVFEDLQLTYHELNCRANQVAHRLRKLGVGPDDLVALYLDRSLDMAVAVLGVLKAGGAYLPMDLVYPQDRLAFMLDESEAKVLLTQEPLLDQLPEHDARVVCLDRDWESIAEESDATPPCRTTADNLAYVIYTSGSTGRPKGALITHANVTRLLTQTEAWFHFSADDVWTMFHSYAFDFSVWELWGALLYGGKVVVVPYWVSRSPEAFHELLCREQVTVLNQTPSAFNQLIAADEQAESKSQQLCLRYVIFGGEALNPQTLKPWFERHGDQHPQLVNMYGITETTVHVTYYPLSRADLDHPSRSPIGRPIPDLQIYVLDDYGQLTPVGVPGELHVGGAGVARGYLKRPELTQQRFLKDPYSGQADARLYKTGDRGRWLPSGCLEYLGRGDDQVKIRGFRIELGEIESVLAEHPTVRQVAVMLREDRCGDQRLAAYIVPDGESSASPGDLRTFVEKKLPNYMVPSAFVTLEKLPLTHNGKVDRRALPALDDSRPDLSVGYVAPRNELERRLAEMWQELLGVDRAGVHDDFFELGGHSLVATQVISRINEEFEVWISLRDLFAAPTIEAMAARVVAARESGARASLPTIEPASREGSLPLSFGQEALWVISQLEAEASAYAMFPAGRIKGPLNLQALERTLDEIVRRHESMRTTFVTVDGDPVQVVAPHTPFQLPVVDLSHLPADEQEDEVKRYVQSQSLQRIDLSKGPLARIELLRLREDEHVVVVGMHHIIYDGWSLEVLRRELIAAYRAFSAGHGSPLAELPVQYADYAVWQRERLAGDTLSGLSDYWQKQLAGVPALELPTDRPRPAIRTTRGTLSDGRLSEPLSRAIGQLSTEEGATTFMTLLAGVQVLLKCYSGQDDFAVGSPVAGRLRPEIEGLIGYFVNTLALRADLDGNPTFRELVRRVRETALEAFDHQELPFERLVEDLQPSRDTSRHPVFQVLFVLQNQLDQQTEPQDESVELKFSMASPPHSRLDFDLMLMASQTPDGIQLQLTGNADLFEQETVARMLQHLQLVLQDAVSDPDRPIADLVPLSDDERQQVLRDFNDTAAEFPQESCVHGLFEAQVARTPDEVAVDFAGQQLTFRELNARANQLAHHLRELGVGPNVLVGICLERSLEMAVAIPAVLKAGGAYVPFDPAYPTERLRVMLEDAQPLVVLTQQDLMPRLPESPGQRVLVDVDPAIERQSRENPAPLAGPTDLLYVLYTSGSTGKPKGVAMEHRPLVNLIAWQVGSSSLAAGARTLQFTSLNFDVSCQEIFATWCAGGTLVLVDEETRRDTERLLTFLEQNRVERLFMPFVALQQLAELGSGSQPCNLSLREINTAGEQLRVTPQLIEFFEKLEGCTLENQYGPTEAHVVTACRLTGPPARWPALPAIGRPIANTQIYLLDRHAHPVPMGVPGELYIGGTAVARGYLNRPELTDEKFVADPFSDQPGARLYKTGDLARWLPDGNIEFLGRADDQVKIRGFRVELGEVEAVLSKHPAVQQAVVVVREPAPGDKRLVGYVVSKEQPAPATSELRAFLEQQLPDYMVPSAFVSLDALPLTPSGKVNRLALPELDSTHPDLAGEYVAPRNDLERQLAELWQELLHVTQVGIHDDFFELGGHSLLATRLIAGMQKSMDVRLPLRDIFETPTIAELADCITQKRQSRSLASLPPIVPATREGHLPLSYGQEAMFLISQFQRGPSPYRMHPAVRVHGRLNVSALEQAFNELLRRHESLRTTFTAQDGSPRQVIAPYAHRELPLTTLSGLSASEQEHAVQRHALSQSQQPIDLAKGPLARVELVQLSDTEHVVLVGLHHIIFDGWSLGVLARELLATYRAFEATQPSPVPDLPIQYADYAVWQRERLTGAVLADLRDHWLKRLRGVPPLELPTDHPRPKQRTTHGADRGCLLSHDVSHALKDLGQQEQATLFMTLLAVFQVLLGRYSGQKDFAVGTPSAGRLRPETENLIGMFVNMLVLRADLSDDPSFRELLHRVRETALDAYDHQELPFELLVRELSPRRDTSRHPVFQTACVLQNYPFESQELSDLELSGLEHAAEEGAADFDLSLFAYEVDEGLRLSLVYRTDLFDEPTIERMLAHYQVLLHGALDNPDQPISQLPMMTEQERQQVLVDWNKPQAAGMECVQQLFESQVARNPEAVAAVFEDRQITYGELNRRANQVAHRLQKLGVQPDDLVALYMDRSLDMVVALLGVLKAGGAYLPMDLVYPQDRLAFMLGESEAKVLLTQEPLLDQLPEHGAHVICLDRDGEALAAESGDNPPCRTTADNLAYVIYTSGSTGRPKGALITHANVTRLFTQTEAWFHFSASDVWTMFHSYAFDFSVWELWGALLYGGKVVVVPYWVSRSPEAFHELLCREQVTVLNQTPSAFNQLIAADEQAQSNPQQLGLRLVIFGGEALNPQTLKPWYARYGDRTPQLVNMYGITETTVHVTYYPLSRVDVDQPSRSPIGRPIPDLQIYIHDENGQLTPVGVPGELYVGGAGVARGYLKRPELTRERFLPDPYSGKPGARLYKTGDVGRWLPDGCLDYMGRGDDQVKVRGFRIELGEVESVLAEHPDVGQVAVMLREDRPGDKRLAAYIVVDGEASLSPGDLRTFVEKKLPNYMVPSAFVTLEKLPLTSNGKVDRRALPALDDSRPELAVEYVAPRNEVERQLAEMWQEVLTVDRVGIRDDFFELGGHSLLAFELVTRVHGTFAVDLPLPLLFDSPTIADTAELINKIREGVDLTTVAIGSSVDWEAELELTADIRITDELLPAVAEPARILLTGATGFLGAYLLRELLEQTDAEVYCLVRSKNPDAAREKLARNLEQYELTLDASSPRIVPVCGDLARPRLGLSAETFDALAASVDAIYHNGAQVSVVAPYRLLKPANVGGTTEVLRLATQMKIKPVHFVSAISVFDAPEYALKARIDENQPLEIVGGLDTGYAQSKCVAEILVRAAGSRGVPVAVYRPGLVTSDSASGAASLSDYTAFLTGLCVELGTAPAVHHEVTMTPVDFVARGIVALSASRDSLGGTFHMLSRQSVTLRDVYQAIRSAGYALEEVPPTRWTTQVIEHGGESSDEMLAVFSGVLRGAGINQTEEAAEESGQPHREIDSSATIGRLDRLAIDCPPVDVAVLTRYIRFLGRKGFLPPPAQSDASTGPSLAKYEPKGSGQSLVRLRPGGPQPPLFCISGLGGHVAAFMPLASGLNEKRPIYALQAQGLEAGQVPQERVEDMAASYLLEIRAAQARGPYLLAGWSLGGVIALEAARQLTAAGEQVGMLAMLDTYLSVTDADPEQMDDNSVLGWIAPRLEMPWEELKRLPLEQQWERIAEQAQQKGGLGMAEIRRLAEVCKAQLAAASRYRPVPYDGAAVLYRAHKTRGRLDKRWKTLCPQLQVEKVPGDHFSMLRKPDVDVLIERLSRLLP